MANAVFFQICSVFYSILIIFVYFSKPRFKSVENNIYSKLIIVNFIGLIIDILCYFAAINNVNSFIVIIICRAMLIYLLTWILLMTIYIYVISAVINKKGNLIKKRYHKFKIFMLSLYIISVLLCLFLPIDYISKGSYTYSFGLANYYVYFLSIILVIMWIALMIKNISHVQKTKYYPMFAYIFIGTIAILIQFYNPQLLLMTSMETFITILMYFTIENPDMKMIGQLEEARDAADKANRAKTDFLSSMSQEIRTPLNAITA